jgi:hypothetical protein
MRTAPLLVVPLLLAAGCSSGSDAAAPTPTATFVLPTPDPTTPAPTATATPTPSTTPTVTPSAAPTRAVPAADRDVDGDGLRDAITATATVLRITLSSTGKVVTAPVHADDPRPTQLLGTADIDRDGRAEVFLQTAEGASTQFATPYRFDGTSLRELQLDGAPARLGIGGSVTHGDGFRCLPTGQLEVRQAQSSDGSSFAVQARRYAVVGDQLVLRASSSTRAKQGDAAVQSAYTADCGTVGD